MLTQDCNWKAKGMIFEMSWSILTALREIPTYMYIKAGMPQKLDPPSKLVVKNLDHWTGRGENTLFRWPQKKNIEDKGLESPTIEQPWRASPNISGHLNDLKPRFLQQSPTYFPSLWVLKTNTDPKHRLGRFRMDIGICSEGRSLPESAAIWRPAAVWKQQPTAQSLGSQLWRSRWARRKWYPEAVGEKNHRDGMLSDNPRGNPNQNRGIILLKPGIFHHFPQCLFTRKPLLPSVGSFANTSMFGTAPNDLAIGQLAKWRMFQNIPWVPSTRIDDHERLQDVGWT